MDFLKPLFGEEALTFAQFTEKLQSQSEIKIANLASGDYVSKDKYGTLEAQLTALQGTVKERDGQIETLKTSAGDNAKLLKQIETMQEENKTAAEAHAAEVKSLKVNAAVDAALANAGAKNKTAARALLSNLDNAELADDGTIKGLSEQITALVEGEETSFLFSGNKPEISGASPASGADKTPDLARGSFEARYAEARKNNDNVSSIAIKREAAEAGVFL